MENYMMILVVMVILVFAAVLAIALIVRFQLDKHKTETKEVVERLQQSTDRLNSTLSNNQARGKWGERTVEDILNNFGLVDKIHFEKQTQVEKGRPDFTFMASTDKECKKLNMDVKFPFNAYERYLKAEGDEEAEKQHKADFKRDVGRHITAVATRKYINEETVDYVLLFIPNESIYGFINRHYPDLIDQAMTKKVVMCSPVMLFNILSIFHNFIEIYELERKGPEVQRQVREFQNQWEEYGAKVGQLGVSLKAALNHYKQLEAARTNKLEKCMKRILELQLGLESDDSDESNEIVESGYESDHSVEGEDRNEDYDDTSKDITEIQIHIRRGKEELGPFSPKETKRQLAEGKLSESDLAWHEGLDGWKPLDQLQLT